MLRSLVFQGTLEICPDQQTVLETNNNGWEPLKEVNESGEMQGSIRKNIRFVGDLLLGG